MKSKRTTLRSYFPQNALLFVLFYLTINQWSSAATSSVEAIENGAIVATPEMQVKVQFHDQDIVRIVKWLPDGSAAKESLIVLPQALPDMEVSVKESEG